MFYVLAAVLIGIPLLVFGGLALANRSEAGYETAWNKAMARKTGAPAPDLSDDD